MYNPSSLNGLSIIKVLNGLSKSIGIFRKIIPIYKEVKPLFKNLSNVLSNVKIQPENSSNIQPNFKERNNLNRPVFFQ